MLGGLTLVARAVCAAIDSPYDQSLAAFLSQTAGFCEEGELNRDMDLARRILREMEAAPFTGGAVSLSFSDVPDEHVQYHLLLLSEAGLMRVADASSMDGPAYLPIRLTWHGHEFLDASRNDTFWEKAKSMVLKKTGGLAFEMLLVVLKDYAKQALFGPGASAG